MAYSGEKGISRREFLKMAVAFGSGLVAASCGLQANDVLEPASTPIGLPTTADSNQNGQQIEGTIYPYPPIVATEWAIDLDSETNKLKFNSFKLYPAVGSWQFQIPGTNNFSAESYRRAIDLKSDWLNLVAIGDLNTNTSQMSEADLNTYRQNMAASLNSEQVLKETLEFIKAQLIARSENPQNFAESERLSKIELENVVVVLDTSDESKSTIRDVIIMDVNGVPRQRFALENSDGELYIRRLRNEEIMPLMPPLLISNGRTIRTDTGEAIMLEGINSGTLKFDGDDYLGHFDRIRNAGGNMITIALNKDLIDSPEYMSDLIEELYSARNKFGLRILLSIGWKGNREQNDMILNADDSLDDYWNSLLNYQNLDNPNLGGQKFAFFIKDKIDFFDLLWEPSNNQLTVFDQNYKKACSDIRIAVGNNAICGFAPGTNNADNPPEFIGNQKPYIAINQANVDTWKKEYRNSFVSVHPYYVDSYDDPSGIGWSNYENLTTRRDPRLWMKPLIDAGVVIIVTESGWRDPGLSYHWLMGNHPGEPRYDPNFPKIINGIETTDGVYDFYKKNRISFVIDDINLLIELHKRYPEN